MIVEYRPVAWMNMIASGRCDQIGFLRDIHSVTHIQKGRRKNMLIQRCCAQEKKKILDRAPRFRFRTESEDLDWHQRVALGMPHVFTRPALAQLVQLGVLSSQQTWPSSSRSSPPRALSPRWTVSSNLASLVYSSQKKRISRKNSVFFVDVR